MNKTVAPGGIANIPVLPLRGLTVFPGMILHFDVGREKSMRALEETMHSGQLIFLVAQKDIRTDDPKIDDISALLRYCNGIFCWYGT